MNKKFQLLEHTADIKLRIFGKTKESLFRHALFGMFCAIEPIPPVPEEWFVQDNICELFSIRHHFEIESIDEESLLVDFLSHAWYLSDVYNEAYFDAQLSALTRTSVSATIYGMKIQRFERSEIKAVTYHDLVIKKVDDQWQADIVFDI